MEREKEELDEKKAIFMKIRVGDTLGFNYNYEFASQNQEDEWMDDTCLARGVLVDKDVKNFKIYVKVVESCDRKGIVIYNNDNIRIYDEETEKWSRPEKRRVRYLKKRKAAWFEVDDWEME